MLCEHLLAERVLKQENYMSSSGIYKKADEELHKISEYDPANTRCSPSVGVMLGKRRRRWANGNPTLGGYFVFNGESCVV